MIGSTSTTSMEENDYDKVPVDAMSGIKNSIPKDFPKFNNISDSQPSSSGYKTLEPQRQVTPNVYDAPLTKSHINAISARGDRKSKKCARKVQNLLRTFILLSTVLSVAALAVAVVSIVMVTHQIAECKGQVESLIEEFCDNVITGGQDNGLPCGMVDKWNDTACNCTSTAINMTSCP